VQSEERLIALVILNKLSLDKQCSLTIAQSSVFTADNLRSMFAQATARQSPESRILLKLIRNVADNQPSLIDGFDKEIVEAARKNADNQDALNDIFAVSSRAKITSGRAKFFSGNKEYVAVILKVLANQKSLPQLVLECVMFVSSVVLWSEPAKALGPRFVDRIVDVFSATPEDLDMQCQCMFAFYRFICHGDTRKALIDHTNVIPAIIEHSASRNTVVMKLATSVLEGLVLFDKSWEERIKRPRYLAFNGEWLRALKQ
jgi:hypothetical protein